MPKDTAATTVTDRLRMISIALFKMGMQIKRIQNLLKRGVKGQDLVSQVRVSQEDMIFTIKLSMRTCSLQTYLQKTLF